MSADKRGPDGGSGNDSRPLPERWTNFRNCDGGGRMGFPNSQHKGATGSG